MLNVGASNIVLGAGVSGLSAGIASGWPIYEAENFPGGNCSSYYLRPGERKHKHLPPDNGEAYRFEFGGGHWIHCRDNLLLRFIRTLIPVKTYTRLSSVYFPDKDLFVPYPLQNNLRYLDSEFAKIILGEMAVSRNPENPSITMADWLRENFGPSLCQLFFDPFHETYTAGLWRNIAPQDAYKSPVNLPLSIQGSLKKSPSIGYNVKFVYPEYGLNHLTQRMAKDCHINYGKKVVKIDVYNKTVYFCDSTCIRYDKLISTLPLNSMLAITGIVLNEKPDPFVSTLVLNIAAIKGDRCPSDHWCYIPKSKSGFHRVGFYSNVDPSFLPISCRNAQDHVAIYVEINFKGHVKLTEYEVGLLSNKVVQELNDWGWIKDIILCDPTWVEISYSWTWPGSLWHQNAQRILAEYNIFQTGRFACWLTQGIADSMRDGLLAGSIINKMN